MPHDEAGQPSQGHGHSMPSGWTGAIRRLCEGADDGLDEVQGLDIRAWPRLLSGWSAGPQRQPTSRASGGVRRRCLGPWPLCWIGVVPHHGGFPMAKRVDRLKRPFVAGPGQVLITRDPDGVTGLGHQDHPRAGRRAVRAPDRRGSGARRGWSVAAWASLQPIRQGQPWLVRCARR